MQYSITLVGGDHRQYYLAQSLKECGFDVACFDVPNILNTHPTLPNALRSASAVVLPMPALTADGLIRCEKGGIPLESVLLHLPSDAVIFGGGLKAASKLLAQNPHRVFDYLDDEALTVSNAAVTAEGALRIAMERMPRTLWQSHVLVIGAGRIGKLLALRLKALGAEVSVSARKPADFAWTQALGLTSEKTGAYLSGLHPYACIFNTVPAPVLQKEHLRAIADDCPIIDLASGQGALASDTHEPENYIRASGLPGKEAPQTAGELLKTFIVRTFDGL